MDLLENLLAENKPHIQTTQDYNPEFHEPSNTQKSQNSLPKELPKNPHICGKYIRSNEYFSVYQNSLLNNTSQSIRPENSTVQNQPEYQLIIRFNGLANPHLSLIQVYRFLNPFDCQIFPIIKVQMHVQDRKGKQIEPKNGTKIGQKSQKIEQELDQTQQIEGKDQSSQFDQTYQIKSKDQSSQSGKNHRKRTEILNKISLQFLYFLMKCFNSFWQQKMSKSDQFSLLREFEQLIDPKGLVPGLDTQTLSQIFKILNIKDDFKIEQGLLVQKFLLTKLYQLYGLSIPQRHLFTPENLNFQDFIKVCEYQNSFLDGFQAPYDQKIHRIQLIFGSFKRRRLFQCINSVFNLQGNSREQKETYLSRSRSTLQTFAWIIQFFVENLQKYNFSTLDKKEQQIKALHKYTEQKQRIHHLRYSLHSHNKYSYLVSSSHGLIDKALPKKQPLFLYQIQDLKDRLDQTSIIQNFTQLVMEYYEFFDQFEQKQMRDKKYLIPLSLKTIILNSSTRKLQLDKLQILKLLFGLEERPLTIQLYIVFIKRQQYTVRERVLLQLKQILKVQVQKIGLNQTQKSIMTKSLLPFISLIMIFYQIHKKIDHFEEDLQNFCGKKNLQFYLLQILHRLFQQKAGNENVNNAFLHDLIQKIRSVLSATKFYQFLNSHKERTNNSPD